MRPLGGGKGTLVPGTSVRFNAQVTVFMNRQHSITNEEFETASETTSITCSMFPFLVMRHFTSRVTSEVALIVGALELAMYVVLVIVMSQYGMSFETVATLATSPFGSVGVVGL